MIRRLLLATLAVVALLAGGCSDDDTAGPDTADGPTDTAADSESGSGSASAPAEEESAEAPEAEDACAAAAEAAAADEAAAAFPDNPDVAWAVESAEPDGEGRVVVEVVPSPDEVGYPAFRLVSACDDMEPVRLGIYALDGETWVLLSTTDAPGATDLPPTLD